MLKQHCAEKTEYVKFSLKKLGFTFVDSVQYMGPFWPSTYEAQQACHIFQTSSLLLIGG